VSEPALAGFGRRSQAQRAGVRSEAAAPTLCGRAWRLPEEALIKLDVGLGLAEKVPVWHRPEIIVPTGWSAGSGNRRRQ